MLSNLPTYFLISFPIICRSGKREKKLKEFPLGWIGLEYFLPINLQWQIGDYEANSFSFFDDEKSPQGMGQWNHP